MQYGTIHSENNYTYIGSIQHNDMEQYGKIVFANSDEYTGMFRNSHMTGYGIYSFANGDNYSGYFVNDVPHGIGTYQTPKWIMKGNWVNSERDGWFTLTIKDTKVTKLQRYAKNILQHEKIIQYVTPETLKTTPQVSIVMQKYQPKQCVSCDKAADSVIEACGHVICCWTCLARLTVCPLCRVEIGKKIKMYI